jgi:hypothetical protein
VQDKFLRLEARMSAIIFRPSVLKSSLAGPKPDRVAHARLEFALNHSAYSVRDISPAASASVRNVASTSLASRFPFVCLVCFVGNFQFQTGQKFTEGIVRLLANGLLDSSFEIARFQPGDPSWD